MLQGAVVGGSASVCDWVPCGRSRVLRYGEHVSADARDDTVTASLPSEQFWTSPWTGGLYESRALAVDICRIMPLLATSPATLRVALSASGMNMPCSGMSLLTRLEGAFRDAQGRQHNRWPALRIRRCQWFVDASIAAGFRLPTQDLQYPIEKYCIAQQPVERRFQVKMRMLSTGSQASDPVYGDYMRLVNAL